MTSSLRLLIVFVLTCLPNAHAGNPMRCIPETFRPTSASDDFGFAVAIVENTAVVGGTEEVYIYQLEDALWIERQRLTSSGTASWFGSSVSLSGNVLAVGSNGAVYFYRLEGATWVEHQVVESSDPENSTFGGPVHVAGDVALINGRYFTDFPYSTHTERAIYVYRFNGVTWEFEQRLISDQVELYDVFGHSLALSGNSIVVGMNDDARVFHFDGSTWNHDQTLTVPVANPSPQNVLPVAMNNQTIMIGADYDSNYVGAVYAFEFDGTAWHFAEKLVPLDAQEWDHFGGPIAISGDRALIGAWGHSHEPNYLGTAYVFRFDGNQWIQEHEFNAPEPGMEFARRGLELSGDIALVGQSGAVHVYCLGLGACCDHRSGVCSPDTLHSSCVFPFQDWSDLTDCSTVDCAPIIGACCTALPDLESTCEQTTMVDCPAGLSVYFTPDTSCEDAPCRQPCSTQETSGSTVQSISGFGQSVAIDGAIAVVGSHRDEDFPCTGSATVFVFQNGAWTETAELHPLQYQQCDRFGASVAVSGATIVVGAPSETTNGYPPPAAYVFRHDGATWNQEAKLVPGDGTKLFGEFVAVSGNEMVISARHTAYVYRFDGVQWLQDEIIMNSGFTSHVSIDGDVTLIGGRVFRRNGSTWVQEPFLLNDGSTVFTIDVGSFWDHQVSVSGDVALFGRYRENRPGVATVFRFNGSAWVYEQELFPSTSRINDFFGSSVAIVGNRAVVSALLADGGSPSTGAAFVFKFNGANWVQESSLWIPNATSSDMFGYSVAFDGVTAIVGEPEGFGRASATGTAYAFRISGAGSCCNRRFGSCTSCELQTDCEDAEQTWTDGSSCSLAACAPALGACCDRALSGNPTQAECNETNIADCNCTDCEWTIDATCADIVCEPTYGPIPTVSEWGLIALTLCLLIGAKIAFSTRTSLV
jgi:hypothetical protein